MRIDTLQNDADLDALAARLFGQASPASQPALKARLIELNPQLATFASLPAGTPLLVPESAADDSDPRLNAALARAASVLDDVEGRNRDAIAQSRAALLQSTTLLQTPLFRDAAKTDSDLAAALNSVSDAASSQLAALDDSSKFLDDQLTNARIAIAVIAAPPGSVRRRPVG